MNKLIFLLTLFSAIVYAESHQGMPPNKAMDKELMQHMQGSMQQMDLKQLEKAAACMDNLDLSMMDGLEKEGTKMEAKIGALCQSGKRRQAQDRAMHYATEMMSRPGMKKIQQNGCWHDAKMPCEKMGKGQHVSDDDNLVTTY